ncbi:hypothetical protein GA0074695_5552 [Micromonospora viridifaciens]|uniref:Uncharacterized protein n=1 Tax=Micromonospora viridifaciens TaxID=1881 RepID=A0A1C4ZGF0_MICVI|nr:hypothetical protein [Micromonospora viridifaciens]SCF32072.1 hypothetical protein GA0074695_5552 [Micromonospora viridifaciens]
MAQAAFAPEPAPQHGEQSFDVLRWHDEPWTAQLALELLPETHGPKVEVLSGRQPFEFSVDPADLLDEEAPVEDPDNEG